MCKTFTQSLSEINTLFPICTHSELNRKKEKKTTKPHITDKAVASTDVNSDLKSHISFPRNLCCTKHACVCTMYAVLCTWTCLKLFLLKYIKKFLQAKYMKKVHNRFPIPNVFRGEEPKYL